MYNSARYYDAATGEFLSPDPLEFVDSMSVYRGHFRLGGIDPFGYEWIIHREGGKKAKAVPSSREDTIAELAILIGLDASEASKWLTIKNDSGMPIPPKGDPIGWSFCDIPEFEVPNTMVTIWAGEMGIFGRLFVTFGKEEKYLKSLGFRVLPVSQGHPNAQLGPVPMSSSIVYSILEETSADKELHGVFGWGHGQTPFCGFGSRLDGLGGVAIEEDMKYYYDVIEKKTAYHFGLTLINACYSEKGSRKLTAQNGKTRGHSGILDPTNTNAFGPCDIIWLKDLIKPGDQGTKVGR